MFKLMKFDQDAMVDFRSRTAENEWGRGRGGGTDRKMCSQRLRNKYMKTHCQTDFGGICSAQARHLVKYT